eukprot:COSAG01_NODE_2372_length_7810_cov_5.360135_5_plen_499_part_00
MNASLNQLCFLLKEQSHLQSAVAVLQWDQEVFLPEGAIASRSEQVAALSKLLHEKQCASAFERLLAKHINLSDGSLLDTDNYDLADKRLLYWVHRDWQRAKALPSDFVAEYAALKSQAQHEWQKARAAKDFTIFQPYLARLVDCVQRYAAFIAPEKPPYDVLLDDFEPGMTADAISAVFDPLQDAILDLLPKIKNPDLLHFKQPFDIAAQEDFNNRLLYDLGFDKKYGRMDRSTHPFTTTFHPTDVRLTTRYSENDLFEALSSTVHEAGHGMYEQGLPLKWAHLPLGQAVSLGIHESQSRLWENMVMKSKPFWRYYYPKLQAAFPDQLSRISLDQFYGQSKQVKPSLIRVEADEVTYNLHIMIRFNLEKQLISGELPVADLPKAWDDAYESLLGCRPAHVAEGVLQDVHWSCGLFGYFPTYALGNIYAGQLYEQLQKDMPNLHQDFEKGQFLPLRDCLRKHIHNHGALYDADELARHYCGQGLNAAPFLTYLKDKYID